MSSHILNETEFRLTGRRVLLIFLCFFGVIAAANAVLVTSALRTWSGLEERSPYRAGQLYNAEIAAARAQEARGWTTEIHSVRLGDRLALDIVAKDASGRALRGYEARVLLERPIDKRQDVDVKLGETSPGRYRGEAEQVAAGQWEMVLDLMDGETRVYRRRARMMLQ